MAYKSSNPALNKKTFENLNTTDSNTMTLQGVATKSMLLLALCLGTGYFGWQVVANNNEYAGLLVLGSLILGFGIALVTIFKKTLAPITAPLYALVEGFLLGAISQTFETEFNGIVLQAILLTVGIFLSMLLLYLFRIIKVTENLKLGIAAATGGIALFYLTSLVVGFFGGSIPLIASTSGWGIAFTVFVIVIAAFNLVMDFDFIELGVEKKAPKYMEWYASFGLLVTLVWLYLEILRLLAKLRSR